MGHERPQHLDLQIDGVVEVRRVDVGAGRQRSSAAAWIREHDSSGCKPSAARLPKARFTAMVVMPGTTDSASRTRVSSPVASTGTADQRSLRSPQIDRSRVARLTRSERASPHPVCIFIFVPTGWTPEGLLTHLLSMERRWIVWGFCGEDVAEPWGDSGPDGGWRALPDRTVEQLVQELVEQGTLTRQIVTGATLTDVASPGGRFSAEAGPTPTLLSILLHVQQEYTRHAGHLDIACEILAGVTGE